MHQWPRAPRVKVSEQPVQLPGVVEGAEVAVAAYTLASDEHSGDLGAQGRVHTTHLPPMNTRGTWGHKGGYTLHTCLR